MTGLQVQAQFDVTTLSLANEPAIDALSLLVQVVHSKTGSAGIFNWGSWGQPKIDTLIGAASPQ